MQWTVLYAKDTMQAHISFAKLVDADSLDFYTETGLMKKYNIWNKWDPQKFVC